MLIENLSNPDIVSRGQNQLSDRVAGLSGRQCIAEQEVPHCFLAEFN
jgi:hypothetical protein